ncbi:Aldo/keto reductase [Auriscalpium vulgare]|uniref:Aldo/keto reductase n=1 Tax=Auriscalpium vulgare TaxID=40419 RepID=A0ACB8S2X7_9AGAM|nr:Aldo/keto reductase [Auriscalpium vulgare]
MSLPTRKIGSTPVSAIGFGGMGLSIAYGPVPDDEERFAVLDAVHAGGCTNWDTADAYGDNEVLIGKWFARTGKRKDIFLATKVGVAGPREGHWPNGDPDYVRSQFKNSLERLQTDYVDLYYLHRADPTVPIEKTVGAMAEFVKEGKIKYLGLSEVSAATLRRAHAVHPISALQVEYSPFDLGIESEELGLLAAARELGVAIVAYSPLGRGLVTGQIKSPDDFGVTDFRRHVERFKKENFPRILELADGLKNIGAAHNATAGQVAIAWLLAISEDIIPIPGTKKIKYLEENLGAAKVTLSAAEVQAVRDLAESAQKTLTGKRYPDLLIPFAYADTPALE